MSALKGYHLNQFWKETVVLDAQALTDTDWLHFEHFCTLDIKYI